MRCAVFCLQRVGAMLLLAAAALAGASAGAADAGWPAYGGDDAGTRYSSADAITPGNVDGLRRQWTYRTGDATRRTAALLKRTKFETTPILVGDRLVLCTPFNEVIALDPADGHALWRHDPQVATDRRPANRYNCRGVAQWHDPLAQPGDACATRILSATNDARLIALDAADGRSCPGFGQQGEMRIPDLEPLRWPGEFQLTSAPVVADGVVIIGSAINDNGRVDAPSGRVRAFDARTGAPRWHWEPLRARDTADADADAAIDSAGSSNRASAANESSAAGAVAATAALPPGAANVWAPLSVDLQRGLVFLPTSSPSPDFYGGQRPGDNRDANSVVALRVADGSVAWRFQIVKHDIWDYDVPAQPTLSTIEVAGRPRDVVVQATKQGFVFVLDRDTGEPVFPVEERAVPQGGAPGEQLAATQIYPVDLPALVPQQLRAEDAYGFTFFDRHACRDKLAALRSEGLYTPPGMQGTVLFPATSGGVNWGGIAIDPKDVVYVNTTRMVHAVTLIPRADFDAVKAASPGKEVSPQAGTPFGMKRERVQSPFGAPCNPPPWGALAALDLRSKRIVWQVPLGTTEDALPLGVALHTGMPNFGGPIATAGGLVFIGAAMDRYLRAFDAASGAELWRGRLPAPATATPMTYLWKGRQYLVAAAGGHGEAGTVISDAVVAFALPADGEAARSLWDRTIDQPGGRFWAGAVGALLGLLLLLFLLKRAASIRSSRRLAMRRRKAEMLARARG